MNFKYSDVYDKFLSRLFKFVCNWRTVSLFKSVWKKYIMSVAKYLVEILQEAKEKLYPQKQFLNYIKGLVYCFYECGSNMKPT